MTDHFDLGKSADRNLPAHVNPAIDIWGIGFPARDEVAAFQLAGALVGFADQAVFPGTDVRLAQFLGAGFPLHQDFDFLADKGLGNRAGHE